MTSFCLAVMYLLPLGVGYTQAQPNIIFFLADDLGWDDVSFHGSSQIPTPNLDALAADGIILNSHYVLPACAPSRAALQTGLYPIRTGAQGSPSSPDSPWGLPLNVPILPQYLKKRGYETHLVGKWDLGYYMEDYTPTFRGFDSFFGYYNAGEDYYTHTVPVGDTSCLDFWFNTDPVRSENGSYSTTLFTQRAQDIIRNRDESKPLFLLLSYQAVHGSVGGCQLEAPLQNVQKFPYIEEKNRTIFAGMVDALDESVGDVVQTLYEREMLENTVIVFTSDNGGIPWGEVGSRSINWPLRGGKMTLWEGGTRSAAFIWSPLLDRSRTVSNQLMHITDWVPTLYSIAGGSTDEPGELDGQDMWSYLNQGSQSPRVEFLYDINEMATRARGVRYSRFKLVEDDSGVYIDRYRPPPGRAPYQALDDLLQKSAVANVLKKLYGEPELNLPENWRRNATISCQKEEQNFSPDQTLYLFDIDADPCELDNLASRLPDVVAFMKERLSVYEASAATPLKNRFFTSVPFTMQDGLCAPWVSPESPQQSAWPAS